MSTLTAMTEPIGDVDIDDLTSLMEAGSCTAEVGLGGFLPSLVSEDTELELG